MHEDAERVVAVIAVRPAFGEAVAPVQADRFRPGRAGFQHHAGDAGSARRLFQRLQQALGRALAAARRLRLSPGDCLAMREDQPISCANPGRQAARYLVALATQPFAI